MCTESKTTFKHNKVLFILADLLFRLGKGTVYSVKKFEINRKLINKFSNIHDGIKFSSNLIKSGKVSDFLEIIMKKL